MKLKTILIFAFAALFTVGVISCEDMLKVESKTVDTDYKLDEATDTVYSVLGVIKKMQKVADRSIILGEVRGDLVKLTNNATDDLRDLYAYDFKSLKNNKYDQALDYYTIINYCNYILDNTDLNYKKNNKPVFEKEYVVVLCYRAWAYLQLAQAYGEVPFFDKPITGDISLSDANKLNIKQLAQILVTDFKDEYADVEFPDYGDLGGKTTGEGKTAATHKSKDLFIPVRLIMGDLYLWAEDYPHAALCYLQFLTDRKAKDKYSIGNNCLLWRSNDFLYGPTSTYMTLFKDGEYICYIPMEADQYSGTVSDLPNIFNSTKDNYNYYQLTTSPAALAISASQKYCYHCRYSSENDRQWAEYMDKSEEPIVLKRGDLRLQSVIESKTIELTLEESNTGKYSTQGQTLNKINSEKIWLYRKDVVYLRLAEALNRCGLPQTAFAILKTGLCKENIDTLVNRGVLSYEKQKAVDINGVDLSTVYTSFNDERYFTAAKADWKKENMNVSTGASTSYEVFRWGPEGNVGNTFGIHSRGCGNANYDPNYTIGNKLATMPADEKTGDLLKDSIRAVEEYLIDEMALETCFEGYRFGDLMRIAMHRAADKGSNSAFAENTFLAKRVAARMDAKLDEPAFDTYSGRDETLYNKLKGADDHELNKSWFLVLPDEKQSLK